MDLQVSNNYYVYQAYKNGITIPNQNQQAVELLGVVNEILNTTITADMTDYYKELAIHDYIITHCSYGFLTGEDEMNSYKAYGALVNKKAVCSGYSDLMAIFLDRLGIKNYKIINDEHVWNLLYLDEKWQHIDLTWDDPTTFNGKPILIHDFSLIDTSELERISNKLKNNQHVFDKNIYILLFLHKRIRIKK